MQMWHGKEAWAALMEGNPDSASPLTSGSYHRIEASKTPPQNLPSEMTEAAMMETAVVFRV